MTGFPKIPNGWRRLKHGERILNGDKFFSVAANRWIETAMGGLSTVIDSDTYIRKIKKRKAQPKDK